MNDFAKAAIKEAKALSYSIYPDKLDKSQEMNNSSEIMEKPNQQINPNYMNNVDPRRNLKWVEDNAVTSCYNCNIAFSTLIRRHHCRSCGRIFCGRCSNKTTKIPFDLVKSIPDKPSYLIHKVSLGIFKEDKNGELRVCDPCYEHINNLNRPIIKKAIKVFELMKLDIKELRKASSVCKDWRYAARFHLSRFREIQYKLNIEELTKEEKEILWINRNYLRGHSKWLIQLIKSVDTTDTNKMQEVDKILSSPRTINCRNTMCTRFCSKNIEIIDVLDLIKINRNNSVMTRYICEVINNEKLEILSDYLPFIIDNIDNNKIILDILLDKGKDNIKFLSELYWCLKVYIKINTSSNEHLIRYITFIKNSVDENIKTIVMDMMKIQKITLTKNDITEDEQESAIDIESLARKNKIRIPLYPDIEFNNIDKNKIEKKTSSSKPIVIPFDYYNKEGDNPIKKITKKIMYKNEDIRKDHLVINILNIIYRILREQDDLDIVMVKYKVVPTSTTGGYIEMVENASTIFNILNGSTTILNYILANNRKSTIDEIRDRFIKSTALYCIISYLLGIGDRHLDNIMISESGLLFHIDFGFIMGQDPKYSNNKIIRVTPEIIEALGGYGSEDYQKFKYYCARIYNRIRLNVNIFANLLTVFSSIDPTIRLSGIRKEILDRFELGENSVEASDHMGNKIENDQNSLEYVLIDMAYRAKNSSAIQGMSFIKNMFSSGLSNWGSMFSKN